jgi:hypothetical protein
VVGLLAATVIPVDVLCAASAERADRLDYCASSVIRSRIQQPPQDRRSRRSCHVTVSRDAVQDR